MFLKKTEQLCMYRFFEEHSFFSSSVASAAVLCCAVLSAAVAERSSAWWDMVVGLLAAWCTVACWDVHTHGCMHLQSLPQPFAPPQCAVSAPHASFFVHRIAHTPCVGRVCLCSLNALMTLVASSSLSWRVKVPTICLYLEWLYHITKRLWPTVWETPFCVVAQRGAGIPQRHSGCA